MSKRCELQKEYYQQYGNYKGNGKYSDEYVSWLENEVLALRQPPVMCSLPTDDFLSKHLYKTDVLLKFGITEMIHKKDLSKTQLIGVLEYISNLR